MQTPSPEPRLTPDEYLGAAPDAFGDIEVVNGVVVHNMAQSEVHDLVVRRLAAALENARPTDGPCFRVSSDVAVRFADRRRYVVQDVHRRALMLDEPFRLTATFDDLELP